MTKEVKIPQISEDADVATVSEIHVSEGDEIKEGDDLIAVDSDKASVDIPNQEGDGTVKEIKVSKGDEVHVGDVILVMEMAGASTGSATGSKSSATGSEGSASDSEDSVDGEDEKKEGQKGEQETSDEENGKDEESDEDTEEAEDKDQKLQETGRRSKPASTSSADSSEDKEEDIPAAPLARKFARELGIDISDLKSDDPEQRITREDVMAHAKKVIQGKGGDGKKKPAGGGIEPIELPDFSQWGETEREPLSGIRTAVAKNTRISWQNIPHVTQHDKADLTMLQTFRDKMAEKDRKLSITAIMAKICVEALENFPRFNASLDLENRELILKKYYNLSMAVDTDEGLLMPVIKNADQKSLDEINEELVELAKKARDRKLKPEEMKGGNFTISNLGGIGGTSFTPVIFPPQVAILGMSEARVQPMWIDDEFVPAEITTLSLSYDHRVIDGADAARFLRWICDVIEEPFHLLQ